MRLSIIAEATIRGLTEVPPRSTLSLYEITKIGLVVLNITKHCLLELSMRKRNERRI